MAAGIGVGCAFLGQIVLMLGGVLALTRGAVTVLSEWHADEKISEYTRSERKLMVCVATDSVRRSCGSTDLPIGRGASKCRSQDLT
jgi:hypothetical protein